MTTILTNSEYENLPMDGPFKYNNLVRLRTIADGSCFFHALAKSYFKPYITGLLDGKPFIRREFIQNLRKDLSVTLGSKINPSDNSSPLYYDELSRGELKDFSKSVPEYSLKNMQKELDSKRSVDNVYNEFISNQLDKDIYIIDAVKKDIYITGDDNDILYKNRPSVVILYLPGHYELVGLIKRNGDIKTLFNPDHDFIQAIRERINIIQDNN